MDRTHKNSPGINNDRFIHIMHIASGDLWAGAETQLYSLVLALSKITNVKISVVLMNHGVLEQKLRNSHIDVFVLDEHKLSLFQIISKLIKLIKKTRPSVIHTHRIKENILGSISAFLSGKIPCVRTIHGAIEHKFSIYNIYRQSLYYLDQLSGRFLQERIISVSYELTNHIYQQFPPNKVQVIENGIQISNQSSQKINITRERLLNLKIGFIGRLVSIKRVDIFLKIAKYFADNHPSVNYHFSIYGEGPLQDQLASLRNDTGTNDIVSFIGHHNNIENEYSNLDIIIMCSDHEGLPMTLLEAMSHRVLVISHAVGGIPRLLDHGSCGILIEDNKPELYANAIIEISENPDLFIRKIENAFIRVKTFYSANVVAAKYLEVYSAILDA